MGGGGSGEGPQLTPGGESCFWCPWGGVGWGERGCSWNIQYRLGGNIFLPRAHPRQPLLPVLRFLRVYLLRVLAPASRVPSEGRWSKPAVRRMGFGPQG